MTQAFADTSFVASSSIDKRETELLQMPIQQLPQINFL